MKILLLQIRQDDITKEEEYREFLAFGNLQEEELISLNVFDKPEFSPEVLDEYDGLFIGGSSDASVLKPDVYTFVPYCIEMIQYAYEKNVPVFASCFGFQLATLAFGGTVILDKEAMEMGTYPIQLTQQGEQDPFFSLLPSGSIVVSGHSERAETLPPNAINLAYTALCPYHAFTFPNKPFYSFQFHPEVSSSDLINRISRYKAKYLSSDDALDTIIKQVVPTDNVHHLISSFVTRFIRPCEK